MDTGTENKIETFSVGGWLFPVIPEGWEVVSGVGLRHAVDGTKSNVTAAEEGLEADNSLELYLQKQLLVITRYIPGCEIIPPSPASLEGSDCALEVGMKYRVSESETILQTQLYVTRSGCVGVLTFTTTEEEVQSLASDLVVIRNSMKFIPLNDLDESD